MDCPGYLFGVAIYRARVLVRWATALLAVSGLIIVAPSVMPDALYRFLAVPNGIAMVALGNSLWQSTHTSVATPTQRSTAAGVGRLGAPTRPSSARPEQALAGQRIRAVPVSHSFDSGLGYFMTVRRVWRSTNRLVDEYLLEP